MKELENYKEKEFIGVSELAAAAKDILQLVEIPQKREVVAQFPNNRTIRYYLTEGLLPRADSSEGTASVFTYRHLLTLVVIKRLQSQSLPIRIIRRIIENLNTAELEKLLNEPIIVSGDVNDAKIAQMRGESVVVINNQDEIQELLESSFGKLQNEKAEPEIWERFIISEAIELNISQNSGFDKKEKRKLIREIKGLLHLKYSQIK